MKVSEALPKTPAAASPTPLKPLAPQTACSSSISSYGGLCSPLRKLWNAIRAFFASIWGYFFKKPKLHVEATLSYKPAPIQKATLAPLPVTAAISLSPFDQLPKPTSDQAEKIDFLLNHLARADYLSLGWNRSKLESDGDLLRQTLSPLRFLEHILLYKFEELKTIARDQRRMVWPKFTRNLTLSLMKISNSPTFNGELEGFAQKFQLNAEELKLFINNNKRAELIKYIINNSKI